MRKFFVFVLFATSFVIYFSSISISQSLPNFLTSSILYGIFLWCSAQTMLIHPGRPPSNWGFLFGDSRLKKSRYCMICNIFKPLRTHHCSVCNECIVNMDHHCRNKHLAWIDNCIGFFNRKPFILMIFYGLLGVFHSLIVVFPISFQIANSLTTQTSLKDFAKIGLGLWLIIACMVLFKFLYFHLALAFTNMTTIETLELAEDVYNVSRWHNFIQVFGRNPYLWLFPIFKSSGKPVGDGVNWKLKEKVLNSFEISNNTDEKQADIQISENILSKISVPSDFDSDATFINRSETPDIFRSSPINK